MRATHAVLVCSLALVSCGAGEATRTSSAARHSLTQLSNERFRSTTRARLAGDGQRLWAAIEGIKRHGMGYGSAVYQWTSAAGWKLLPRLPDRLGGGYRFDVAARAGLPCVKYTRDRDRGDVIRCLSGRRWVALARGGALSRTARLVEMDAYSGALFVLVDTGRELRVIRRSRNRWTQVGQALPRRRATLGVEVKGAARRPTVGLLRARGTLIERIAYRLRHDRWIPLPALRGIGTGPSVAGPVVVGARTFVAYTHATGQDWPFGIASFGGDGWTKLGGGPLNRGRGAGQGVVGYAHGSPWAVWQENALGTRGFDTTISLLRVDPGEPPTPTELWRGVSNGPGALQVLDGAGTGWVMYMPARPGGRGQRQVVVAPLPSE